MGVKITDIRFNNNFRSGQNLDFLLACIGERVNIEVDFEFQDIVFASTVLNKENAIEFEPINSTVNISDITGIIESEDGSAFTDCFVGDSIKVYDAGLTSFTAYTVTEKIDNGIIRVGSSLGNKVLATDSYVYNTTPFAGLRYTYNLVDSGASFNSLIDGEFQQGESDEVDATVLTDKTVYFTGEKSYQIGSMLIKGRDTEGLNGATGGGNDDIKQLFTLTHNTVITPFFLSNQYNDLLAGKKPTYFEANNTLNYIAELSLGRDLSNPNKIQTLTAVSNQSNVGWFNERFNGGRNNYSISSLILTDVAAATTISQLEFGKEIQVDIIIDNTTDAPFSNTNTNYTFGFNCLPEDSELYDKNGYDQTRNFAFDSKDNVLGSGSVNGDNFGNDLQIIKTLTSTYISATQMKITAVIDTGTDADAILQQGDFDRYQFWVITENHALTASKSDKVNLLASVNEFFVQQAAVDPVISTAGTTFIEHPYTDKLDGVTPVALKLFPVDDLVANTDFYIDFAAAPPTVGGTLATIAGLNYSPVAGVPSTVMAYDLTNNKIIGVASWQGTRISTQEKLRDSINDNVAYGVVFGGYPAYVDNGGYQNATVFTFGLNHAVKFDAPAVGVAYNGIQVQEISSFGGSVVISSATMASGTDGIAGGLSSQGVIIKNIQNKLILRDGDEQQADVLLEEFNFSTANYPLVGDVQDIDFEQDRVFKIPAEIRKTIKCFRDFPNDSGTKKYFTNQYPFMHRWEYWVALFESLTGETIPSELFDNTLEDNGINHFWHRYTTIAYWLIAYDLVFTLEQNGVEFTQTFSSELADSTDFDGNTDWTSNEIKSFDITSGLEIVNGSEKFIKGYENVRIEASFDKTTGPVPDIGQVGIVIWIETYEKGGISDIRRISSFYPVGLDTWFKSVDTSDKVEVTKVGSVFTGKALIDYTKLPKGKEFTIYARIYEFQGGEAKQFMDDTDFDFMDDVQYNFM